ncbi:hypothetical protein D3C76_630310 [compost metagenome]
MERYHNTAGDPPRRDIEGKHQESAELSSLVTQFPASGGQIEQVGFKMSEKPEVFVINVRTTPVYNGTLAADMPLKAKPAASLAPVPTPKRQASKPARAPQPAASALDRKAWLIGMLKTQAMLAEQTSKLARELGISDTELRRLGRRHGLSEVSHGSR